MHLTLIPSAFTAVFDASGGPSVDGTQSFRLTQPLTRTTHTPLDCRLSPVIVVHKLIKATARDVIYPGMQVIGVVGLLLLASQACGQDFNVPSTWRVEFSVQVPIVYTVFTQLVQKPTTTLSKGAIEDMARSVVNTLVPLFSTNGVIPNLTDSQPAYTIAAISRTDYLSGNFTFKQLVSNSLKTVFDINSQTPPMWGLAAASAYRAYNDSTILAYAQGTWDQVSPFQVQPSNASAGFSSAVNASIPSTCNGLTTAGAVFAYPTHPDFPFASPTDVTGETIAAFVALSGHLFEFTQDSKYLDAAIAGAEFIQNHMQEFPIIRDTFTVAGCQEPDLPGYTYITGFAIWGFSILSTYNSTWTSITQDLILSSVPYSMWTNATDGVIIEGNADPTTDLVQDCFKAVWIRGLHEAWTRLDPTSAAANYIQSYLYVQFNALRDHAYNSAIEAYSPMWEGPPVTQLFSWGQLNALDVLNSAFDMVQDPVTSPNATSSTGPNATSSTATSSGPTGASSSSAGSDGSQKSHETPIIVGAVIGSLAALLVGGVLAFFLRRRRHANVSEEPDYVLPVEPNTTSRFSIDAQTAQLSVPIPFSDKDGSTMPSSNPTPSASTVTTTSVPISQPRSSNMYPQSLSYAGTQDAALPQMIADLTHILASIPIIRTLHEPPPQYEDGNDGIEGEHATR